MWRIVSKIILGFLDGRYRILKKAQSWESWMTTFDPVTAFEKQADDKRFVTVPIALYYVSSQFVEIIFYFLLT
ncbi:hypothetical protein AKJ64_00760 [candidate division MSBL1 archaeon SCGC-AAA259E17]|uniref:Uncharacterized protein n=1 Tax=candidate division MSBL1 archaeon SCGC-AAA259E17 TaxID=1698263 RepID=A0A133UGW7_9EURY|nr:hypothetical protein AKJ64_00760 [candidate division MSBL1 archaeon SCGC-AAA259E17]